MLRGGKWCRFWAIYVSNHPIIPSLVPNTFMPSVLFLGTRRLIRVYTVCIQEYL